MLTDQQVFDKALDYFRRDDINKCRGSFNDGNGGKCVLAYIGNISTNCHQTANKEYFKATGRTLTSKIEGILISINDCCRHNKEHQMTQMQGLAKFYDLEYKEIVYNKSYECKSFEKEVA